MHFSTVPVVVVACSCFVRQVNSFFIHNIYSRTYTSSGSEDVTRSRLETCSHLRRCSGIVARRLEDGLSKRLSWRPRRRTAAEIRASASGDGDGWTPLSMVGESNPEELMRQMSIPELARKLEEVESTFGAVHPQIAGVLIPLSQALYANGDMDPARQACTRALKILQRAFGNNPTIEVAECLHTLAMIQQKESPDIGDKALNSQKMAYELAVRLYGPRAIETAAYARCYAQMSEEYAKSLTPGLPRPFYMPNPVPLYRQTLNIIENQLGRSSIEVASALDDLAGALLFWRDDDFSDEKAVTNLPEAEALATRSLEISRNSLGLDHAITAGREHNLGMVKRGLGLGEAARYHFQRALEIKEKILGVDHPEAESARKLVEQHGEEVECPPQSVEERSYVAEEPAEPPSGSVSDA